MLFPRASVLNGLPIVSNDVAQEPWVYLRIFFFTPLSQELSLLHQFYRILVMNMRQQCPEDI
jgi:hypothetical protein